MFVDRYQHHHFVRFCSYNLMDCMCVFHLARLPSKEHFRGHQTSKPLDYQESTYTVLSVTYHYKRFVNSVLDILTLLACTKSLDNLFHTLMVLWENEYLPTSNLLCSFMSVFFNILTLLACIQSVDNLFHTLMMLDALGE